MSKFDHFLAKTEGEEKSKQHNIKQSLKSK